MKYLLYFLRKHYFYFLFVLLEVISLVLLFNYNSYQNTVFSRFSSDVSGSVLGLTSNIYDYFSLKKINRILAQDNARLHSGRPEAYYKTDTLTFYREDTLYKLEYLFISARVVSNTIDLQNNFLMLNKGKKQGIGNHMGVIIGDRIVGQVVSVSNHFSWVMSLLNRNSRISGKFKKNNQLVNVEWNGLDYRRGDVKEIPKHIVIGVGDTIVTSGNSDIFPEGLMIGTIEEFKIIPDENFNTASMLFATDFNSLSYVEIIIDLMRQEKDSLKNSFKTINP
jgi:rod shape-determining protein MreC